MSSDNMKELKPISRDETYETENTSQSSAYSRVGLRRQCSVNSNQSLLSSTPSSESNANGTTDAESEIGNEGGVVKPTPPKEYIPFTLFSVFDEIDKSVKRLIAFIGRFIINERRDDEHIKEFSANFTAPKMRYFIRVFVKNKWFDRFILVVILLSSILMAMSDYSAVNEDNELITEGSAINKIIVGSEPYFTAIFCLEFFSKTLGLGLFGPDSYFEDTWNWLDFIVVFFAVVVSVPYINVNVYTHVCACVYKYAYIS